MFLRKITKHLDLIKKIVPIPPIKYFVTSSLANNALLKKNEKSLTYIPSFGFKFIGIPKKKGMAHHKHKSSQNSWKKRGKINVKYLHRVSNHNGLLKRIKIVENIIFLFILY